MSDMLGTSVPKTTVNEHDNSRFQESEIRFPGQVLRLYGPASETGSD
jgi:hypothetical protein